MSSKRSNGPRHGADQRPAADSAAQAAVAGDVYSALRATGWVIPLDEADVQRAEADLAAHSAELPTALRDCDAVFAGLARGNCAARPITFPGDSDVEAGLARAAREGGVITPEVEQKMRLDRQAAEREMDDGQVDASQ